MTEYRCGTPGRRQLLVDQPPGSPINGIDYLVVSDGDDVPDGLRQRLLRLRFFFPDGVASLTAADVRIEGGVRVRDPAVRWVVPMTEVAAPGGPAVDPAFDPELVAADRTWLGDLATATANPDEWLVVCLEQYGDFSRYRLLVRDGPDAVDPPPGFDLKLSEIEFSFKVECPTPFDCATAKPCPPVVDEVPPIDYLARDYASFRQLMFDRMALTQAEAPSREPAALRSAIVEVLAYAADHVSYYLDAVHTDAYLGPSRGRIAVRRHARLRDYHMHEGCNARAFVQLRASPGDDAVPPTADDPPVLAERTMLLTKVPGHGVVIRPDGLPDALSHAPLVFETMHPLRALHSAHDEILFHTFGDEECCIPAGTTRVALHDPGEALALSPGDFLLLEEVRDPQTEREADADPSRRHVVRLTEVSESIPDPLMSAAAGSDVRFVEAAWHVEDALPFPLFVGTPTTPLAVARGNVVLADHGRSLATEPDEAIALEPFGNQGRLRARLPLPELTWRQAYDATASATACVGQQPRAARPEVTLVGQGEVWTPQRDLLGSTGTSRHFVVETETDRRAWLRFGDDRMGRRPPPTAIFDAEYRVGNGPVGNVGAEAIAHLVAQPGLVDAVAAAIVRGIRNPLPGRGGQAPESIDEVKLYAPHAFRRQERAVTEADWAEVAGRHAQVQRAVATIRWTGSWHTVFVTVDRMGGAEVDDEFAAELLAFLQRYRLAGYDLEVAPPRWVPLDIAMTVCVDRGYLADDVEKRLYAEFGSGLLPDGRRGFFHPDDFSFGESVYLSRIVARATAVPGVRFVDVTPPVATTDPEHRFKRWGERPAGEVEQGFIPLHRLEIARCDNDRNAPDNGQIRFFMEGGA